MWPAMLLPLRTNRGRTTRCLSKLSKYFGLKCKKVRESRPGEHYQLSMPTIRREERERRESTDERINDSQPTPCAAVESRAAAESSLVLAGLYLRRRAVRCDWSSAEQRATDDYSTRPRAAAAAPRGHAAAESASVNHRANSLVG